MPSEMKMTSDSKRAAVTVALELVRAVVGLLLLPPLLVSLLSDAQLASFATGGEWLRLNGTAAACFANAPRFDSRCRYLERSHCEKASCVWGDPSLARCVQAEGSDATCDQLSSERQCRAANAGCSWLPPLELRVACRASPADSPFGGARCDAVASGSPGSIDVLRHEMRILLAQLVAFGLGNLWLVRWHGSIDAVVANGKPYVVGLFLLVVAAGSVRNALRQ